MNNEEHLKSCLRRHEAIKNKFWNEILPSYLEDTDNPRIDCYQNTRENRIIMHGLKLINEKIDQIQDELSKVRR